MNYKLPSLKIIAAAVFFSWSNRAEFMKATAIPTLALVVLWAVWISYSDVLPSYISWLYLLGYGLSFSFLAVTCHRLILIDGADRYKTFSAKPGFRELRFLAWVIVIYAINTFLEFFTQILVQNASSGLFSEGGGNMPDWIKQIASIPALYVLARLSLAFPATAIDKRSSLRWSWIRTQGNGWRIFVVVGLLPWLTSMLLGFMWREEATVLEQVVLSIATFVLLSIEIIALSFTYKELAKHYAIHEQSLSGEIMSAPADVSRVSFHDLASGGKGRKVEVAVSVIVGLVLAFILIGTLDFQLADCSNVVLGSATSPGGAYEAKLVNRTCKDETTMQGLILDVTKSTPPRTTYSYPLLRAVSFEADVVWKSEKRLVVRYGGMLDLSTVPSEIEDIQVVFEKRPEPQEAATVAHRAP